MLVELLVNSVVQLLVISVVELLVNSGSALTLCVQVFYRAWARYFVSSRADLED